MDRFQNKYRILSARAAWHAYGGGIYFVTLCTAGRIHYFGEIKDAEMHLSTVGEIAAKNFADVSTHYPYAEIPLFVIMPNHIHAVVIIDESRISVGAETLSGAVEKRCAALSCDILEMTDISHMQGRLSIVLGGLKSAITKAARQEKVSFAWQLRFYDRIIRNVEEMNRIAEYIEHNVIRWEMDELNV